MMAIYLTTILPAMTLPEALETVGIRSIASLTGDRTTFVTTRLIQVLHHKLVEVRLSGNGPISMLGNSRWRTEEASFRYVATIVYRRLYRSSLRFYLCRGGSAVDLYSPCLQSTIGRVIQ